MARILVLHDQLAANGTLSEMLEKLRHSVIETDALSEVLRHAATGKVDIVVINQQNDSQLSVDSLTILKQIDGLNETPMVVITAATRSSELIETMKLGAFDHLTKPVSMDELEAVINKALARPRNDSTNRVVSDDFLVGLSPVMRSLEKLIGIAASCDVTVLIYGETGTGKNTVARTIHHHSQHKQAPLTIIDCTAVPEDYESFQSLAPGAQGTVVLDEIGDLNTTTQAMLVRALKEPAGESPAPPRIIATTQHDLLALVKKRRFREDLYYRLNVLPLALPPLRERGSDILALAETFLHEARPETPTRFSSSASKWLLDYDWPGNVRELENLIYHLTIVVRSSLIEDTDLKMISPKTMEPDGSDIQSLDYYQTIAAVEKRLFKQALETAHGSRAEAARLLGINRQLLYTKLKAHGLMRE